MNHLLKTINAHDFSKIANNKKLIVIDIRTAAEVKNVYFDGSINIPMGEITISKITDCLRNSGCADGDPIYLLCNSGQRAYQVAKQLAASFSTSLTVIEGGIVALKQQGVDLRKGAGSIISLERQVRIAAGLLVLLGIILGTFLHTTFYGLSALVGVGLVFSGISNTCGMAVMLSRMPWNRFG